MANMRPETLVLQQILRSACIAHGSFDNEGCRFTDGDIETLQAEHNIGSKMARKWAFNLRQRYPNVRRREAMLMSAGAVEENKVHCHLHHTHGLHIAHFA